MRDRRTSLHAASVDDLGAGALVRLRCLGLRLSFAYR